MRLRWFAAGLLAGVVASATTPAVALAQEDGASGEVVALTISATGAPVVRQVVPVQLLRSDGRTVPGRVEVLAPTRGAQVAFWTEPDEPVANRVYVGNLPEGDVAVNVTLPDGKVLFGSAWENSAGGTFYGQFVSDLVP